VDGTIVRTRGQLYQEVGTDSLSNLFDIKIINKTMKDKEVTLRLEGEYEKTGKVSMIGNTNVQLKREDQAAGSFFITLPKKALKQRTVKLQVGLYEGANRITTIKTNFTGPFTKGG
jgi:IG-like fold at C-terminal of FixG, putative oxidoreductase